MLFLESFWKGEVIPGEGRYCSNRAYSEALQVMEKCEETLKKVLSEEDWKTFQQFADAHQELSDLSDCDNFVEGFRMGAKVMMDVLLEEKWKEMSL